MTTIRVLASTFLSMTFLACSMPDPRAPSQREVERGTHGGWVHVTTTAGQLVDGELVAVSPKGIYVLRGSKFEGVWVEQRVVFVQSPEIREAKVWGYDPETFWSWPMGALLYVSLLTVIIPASLVVTTIKADDELRKRSSAIYPAKKLTTLKRWARFPQGMPKGLDPTLLVFPQPPSSAEMPAQ